uniref:Uncharacterized protein n=1 Tax=Candidatus Kentrum eta TaxID=2126337 RepID=A0A450UAV9_9GAMM|nr:MAG: hypothetical protein BECKH772A_GA0070896_1000410 [Candidatus Kentron sp. H]VFJ89305.1 MAG: hypothetical protein BECKH772B_GA0070898_1000410 [Candidatus Kentron sp. H]VFJ95895.1 MAG: hypothetical protein BECKH772C_GA0070978_1000410 [Candidatus Kentron sp. H]
MEFCDEFSSPAYSPPADVDSRGWVAHSHWVIVKERTGWGNEHCIGGNDHSVRVNELSLAGNDHSGRGNRRRADVTDHVRGGKDFSAGGKEPRGCAKGLSRSHQL